MGGARIDRAPREDAMADGKMLRAALVATPAVLAAAAIAIAGHGCGSARRVEGSGPTGSSELNVEIVSVQLARVPGPAGPQVTFRATDRNGAPIDVLAELARAASKTVPYISNGPRFTFAQVEPDGSNTSWYESTVNPAPFTAPAGATPDSKPATQPGFQQAPAANPSSRITANGDGTFTFAYGPPTTPESRRDPSKPLVAGVWLERIADRFSGGPKRWPSSATRITAASGPAPAPHEAVSDAACNTCHVQLRAHDRREAVQLCRTCHSGGAGGVVYRDPESGENIDFRAMIHRIHSGANLPSVRAGGHFFVVGFQQGVSDFTATELPALREATECTVCHRGGADADAWKTKASLVACTACHDNLRFGSAGKACALGVDDVQPCDHVLSPGTVNESSSCAQCHSAGAESPPIGPDVVHRNHLVELASAWKYEILQVTVGNDRRPVVQFRVSRGGAAVDVKNDPAWKQGAASRLFVDVAWPTAELTNEGAGFVDATVTSPQFPSGTPGPGQPVQVNALAASTPVAGQANVFEVTSPTAVPPQFSSLRVVLEGHPAEGTGAAALRVPVPNAVQDVAIGGGSPAPRRAIVSADTCNACHGELSAHGANRNATPAVCVVCHTPRTTDFVRVVQAQNRTSPPPIPDAAEDTVDFKVLIHEIHAADIRKTPVTVFGFGGNPTTFPAAFPGATGRCTICHVGDSYRLPLRPEVQDTTVRAGDPAAQGDPGEQRVGRTIAVCTSCHDMVRFDDTVRRPDCNTLVPVNSAECTHSGGPQAEGSCASCHAAGGAFDTARVHPITEKPQ
jgi:OmcA/MtrC family decaheme c-type cytochrome